MVKRKYTKKSTRKVVKRSPKINKISPAQKLKKQILKYAAAQISGEEEE